LGDARSQAAQTSGDPAQKTTGNWKIFILVGPSQILKLWTALPREFLLPPVWGWEGRKERTNEGGREGGKEGRLEIRMGNDMSPSDSSSKIPHLNHTFQHNFQTLKEK
jgi:hypothetical protein